MEIPLPKKMLKTKTNYRATSIALQDKAWEMEQQNLVWFDESKDN